MNTYCATYVSGEDDDRVVTNIKARDMHAAINKIYEVVGECEITEVVKLHEDD
ncbi:MAG: hypothetical protein IKS11_00130 [Lachnospiraceae bacterium]|nr:hypothetical protein [Lachnospiraceae bacterium]